MKYWFDEGADNNNAVILSCKALLRASVDGNSMQLIKKKLENKIHPKKIFSSSDSVVIPFSAIIEITSRADNPILSLNYKVKGKFYSEQLKFDRIEAKRECLVYIDKLLTKNNNKLQKLEHSLPVFTSILNPSLNFAVSGVITYLFNDTLPYIVLVAVITWLLLSLYILINRFSNPFKVTSWVTQGLFVKENPSGLETSYT